ncbi:MAG: phosphate ABC transporter permease PstA [Pseudomonadota bacterium]
METAKTTVATCDRYRHRRAVDRLARGACLLATAVAVLPLASVLVYVSGKGLPALSWSFFTATPLPVGEPGGGMGNALLGSLILIGIAASIGVPCGIMAGIYLAELGGDSRTGRVVRFAADVLAGTPSITIGIFVYAFVVIWMRRFSAIAGGLALAILMLPTVTRTAEEMLRLVPGSLREAGLALGVPKWRVIISIVLKTGAPGIATGVVLAIARAAGETAPLLFTSLNNRFWSTALDKPIASMPVQIYTYAISPYADWHSQAWAAALVLVVLVLTLNVVARALVHWRGGTR